MLAADALLQLRRVVHAAHRAPCRVRELYPAALLAVGCVEVTIERRLSQGVPRRAYLSAASAAELHAVEDGAGRQSSTCVLKSRPCRALIVRGSMEVWI